jgi:hypothetical protein
MERKAKNVALAAAGFLLVPMGPGLALALASGATSLAAGQQFLPTLQEVKVFAAVWALTYLFSLPASLLLGVPLFAFLLWVRVAHLWTVLLGASTIGAFMIAVLNWPNTPAPTALLWGGSAAALSAFLCWPLWRGIALTQSRAL